MDRTEINNLLYEIREKCSKDNAKEYLVLMEDIFKIKPVTMLFFNVKAKLLCEIGKYEDAVELLTVTINLCFPEEENIETCRIFQRAYKAIGSNTLFKQWCSMEYYVTYTLKQDENSYNKVLLLNEEIIQLQDAFFNRSNDESVKTKLANAYYESWYFVEGAIMQALLLKRSNLDYKDYKFFNERIALEVNHCFLFEELLHKNGTYILLTNEEDYYRAAVIARVLRMLKQRVFLIMQAVPAKVEYNIDLNETVKISMDNIEVDGYGIAKIRPLDIVLNDKIIGNNTALIMEKLSKDTKNDFSIVIGSSQIFNFVNNTKIAKKRMQRLSDFKGDLREGGFVFGYYGSYTSYLSRIYCLNVEEEINKPSEYEFSIVIPVRNSAQSLKYTLQTCLEQRGIDESNYEIIVSDNSDSNYMEVEKLVNEINDARIKYYRTPRYLRLNRSFEYAFIKARGEFIFSIGADDAVLPWGLETLRKVLNKLPYDDVIKWDRGFFVWPNNTKLIEQLGQFNIPRSYNKDNIKIQRENCMKLLFQVLYNPILMYEMPMLYINSGFRRRYFNKLLRDTGRLWDGKTQDVYIGVFNLLIYDTIPYLEYPITIAGMSSNSIGAAESNPNSNIKSNIKRIARDSKGGISVVYGEGVKFIPISVDISLVYYALYRLKNIIPDEKFNLIYNKMNWKEVFRNVLIKSSCKDIMYDYYMKLLKYSAYCHGDEIGKSFDTNLSLYIDLPKVSYHQKEKIYYEGFLLDTGLQLDARKFGVKNVYEATKLFENICNL